MVVVYACCLIVYIIRKTDEKFKRIYYSNNGYWRGKSAIQKLSRASGSAKEEAEKWLMKQPLYQIYLPAPKYIPRPNASMSLFAKPNDIHQADILYLPHDKFKKKTYKYVLNIVDVASRYKGSYQLATKNSENTPLTYPKTLIIDDGKEFYGDTTKLMEKHDVLIQRGDPSQHRSQGSWKGLRSRVRIKCDQWKMTQPGGTKMAISQLLLLVASSNLLGRKSKWYFIIKFSLLLSIIFCWREIRPDAGKTIENKFVASFLSTDHPEKQIQTKLLCC